ncbi:hypothetical protein [Levilactobacillus tujiorum]|uniref:hypothetical protein n=1 Tax=Levilactobacillus tujiorum TaxID=2912243 RepID=UPI0014573F71|nr:hypothetical protein [Levilactobacillus tujiorum]NLR31354.1 hypothetical protein [Levilactobacillus tujiorum]
MYIKKFFIASVALGIFGGSLSLSMTANASNWHSNTPTSIRGTWKKSKKAGSGKYSFKYNYIVRITSHSFAAQGLGDPYYISNVKYKKIGHYSYMFSGKEFYSRKWQHIKVIATKHTIKFKIVSPKSMAMSKYSETAYR